MGPHQHHPAAKAERRQRARRPPRRRLQRLANRARRRAQVALRPHQGQGVASELHTATEGHRSRLRGVQSRPFW